MITCASLWSTQMLQHHKLTHFSTVWTAWDKEALAHKEAGAARLIEERRIAEQVAQARKDEIKNSAA
jgi:hypothetical protein